MKKILFLTVVLIFISCKVYNDERNNFSSIIGEYISSNRKEKLEIKSNGDFILSKQTKGNHNRIHYCEYSSRGQWSKINDELIEITSENYYTKEKGFYCELKQENKLSNDSLYIEIKFPKDLLYYRGKKTMTNVFYFNYDTNNSIRINDTIIKIKKNDYLWQKDNPNNFITFHVNSNISEIDFYKSRIMFDIYEGYINTEKNNYLTFNLPYFDLCFSELELYRNDLIHFRDNKLRWKGQTWEKQIDK